MRDVRDLLLVIGASLIGRFLYDNIRSNRNSAEGNVTQAIANKSSEQCWRVSEPLQPGTAGTARTLEAMKQLVIRDSHSEAVRKAALGIVKGCPGHNFQCEIQRLFDFTRSQVVYRRDPVMQERVQDTQTTLALMSGDCDCKVVALCSLLGSLGHITKFSVVGSSHDDYRHVFCKVWDGAQWVSLDPTPEAAIVGWQARRPAQADYEIFN